MQEKRPITQPQLQTNAQREQEDRRSVLDNIQSIVPNHDARLQGAEVNIHTYTCTHIIAQLTRNQTVTVPSLMPSCAQFCLVRHAEFFNRVSSTRGHAYDQSIMRKIIWSFSWSAACLIFLLPQAAEASRERKKRLQHNGEVLRFEKSLEMAQRQLRETNANVGANHALTDTSKKLSINGDAAAGPAGRDSPTKPAR